MHKFAQNPGNAINTFVLPFVFTDKVKEAVESIWKCHSPLEHRLILIDNSGEEFEDRKWLEENSHLYIRSYRNLGPAMAFNMGIKIAKTKYVTIFSDDARMIGATWFTDAIEKIESGYPGVIISANSIHPQDIAIGEFYNQDHQAHYSDLDRKYGGKIPGFGLACAVSNKETWLEAGSFDETKYIYTIDGTFTDQALKQGVDCYYSGVVFHFGDASHKGRLVEANKYQDTGIYNGKVVL